MEKYCLAVQIVDDNKKHARCILSNKAIDTHSEYVILVAFPQQQLLCEGPSVLRYTYNASIVMLASC